MFMLESGSVLAFLTGMPGWAEILLVAFVGLLLFGKRLPEVARSVGKSVVEFKKGMRDVKDDIDTSASSDSNRGIESRQPTQLPPPGAEATKNGTSD